LLLGALAVLLLLPVLALVLVQSGPAGRLVKGEALAALQRVLPAGMAAEIGETRVVLDGLEGIAVSFRDVALTATEGGREMLLLDRVTVGTRTLSVLRGDPQVEYLTLRGGRLDAAGNGATPVAWPAVASVENHLGALLDMAAETVEHTAIGRSALRVEIAGLEIAGAAGGRFGDIVVETAKLSGRGPNRTLKAELSMAGKPVTVSATLSKSPNGAVAARVEAEDFPLPIGRLHTMLSADEADHEPGNINPPIPARLVFNAQRNGADAPGTLSVLAGVDDLTLKLDEGDLVPLEGDLSFNWDSAAKVLRLSDSPMRLGRSSVILTGALRDPPDPTAGAGGGYEFQIVGNNGISDPRDSPANGVRFAFKTAGDWSPGGRVVSFRDIELNSSAGDAEGAGSLDFSSSVPTALIAVSISDFAIRGVKQFWPASVARGARRWILANLAGGRVTSGDILIAEPLRRRIPGTETRLQGSSEVSVNVENVRFDVAGDIPPVRDAVGKVDFKDGTTVITLESGTAYMPSGRTAAASNGTLVIHPQDEDRIVFADLELDVSGSADAVGEIISYRPIDARSYRDYKPEDLSGDVDSRLKLRFVLNPSETTPPPEWDVALDLKGASVATPFEGRQLSDLSGTVKINPRRAEFDVSGKIDGLPAEIDMVQPFVEDVEGRRDIVLKLSDDDRLKIAPGLETILSGTTAVAVSTNGRDADMEIRADLTAAELELPWLGWSKGSGVAATTVFDLVLSGSETRLSNFNLDGNSFSADGNITVSPSGLQNARFGKVRLNASDDVSVSIERKNGGYDITVDGSSFDARSLIRHVRKQLSATDDGEAGTPVNLTARVGKVTGFGDETMRDLTLEMRHDGRDLVALTANASTATGFPVSIGLEGAGANRKVHVDALGAGEFLRFLDIYGQVRGGVASLSLSGTGRSGLAGDAQLTDFRIFNEPRLKSLVASRSANSQSLNQAINRDIDTSEVKFDNASARLIIGQSSLAVEKGVVRGPLVGSTFQGTVFDKDDRMRITGTFLPAYGLNSLFAEIPILGLFLGNGRDRGLIGVTYMLEGDTKKPKVYVNPLSVVAPGIFRSIFEYQ
jgi:hypothetical protein